MSSKELLELTESPPTSSTQIFAIRDKIHEEYAASSSGEERSALLAMLKATLDIAENALLSSGDEQMLAKFREDRADGYTRLLVSESTVDETVSSEMLMAVTNREIEAGRMSHDDPIRQVAVKAAAAPHLSHAELLANSAARRSSSVSIQSLIDEIKSSKDIDIVAVRERVYQEFDAAATSEQRGQVLAIFKATSDLVERNLVARGEQGLLEDFRKARDQDYKIFIVQECTVGLDSPGGGDVSVDALMAVTNREIAASRMAEDHSMRKLAVNGAAALHLSHAELVTKHAALKAQSQKASEVAAPKTLGQKLKTLFRK